ncbi:MAG: SpoIVB peptidase [Lachnospiraceae bacterium]|nr:SpoIVB peptidase [Lachnospiraceae bacterium]
MVRAEFFRWLAGVGFWAVLLFSVKTFWDALPDHIYVKVGDTVSYDFQVPVTVSVKEEETETFLVEGRAKVAENIDPSYYVTCKLFGVLPVKEIAVSVVEGEAVFVGGMPIGIYAKTKGILVIGMGEVIDSSGAKKSPAKNMIKVGDYIVSVNGEPVEEKEDLVKLVNENGEATEVIGLFRDDEFIEVGVDAVLSEQERYMLGVWVRDDMAGIGTLTFYRSDQSFGALGHPINDGDTGEMLLMEEGKLYETDIIGIKRGESGTPGELSGVISYGKDSYLGEIDTNSEIGIYGTLDGNLKKLEVGSYCEIGYKQEIEMGPAVILSAVSGELKEYDVVIEGVNFGSTESNKGILLHVTDKELLKLTGGIVQGMSGSPILQNGRIVGAVTHVLVNDPTRGYGIFIENMLKHN